jgi:hypothetical protein
MQRGVVTVAALGDVAQFLARVNNADTIGASNMEPLSLPHHIRR